MVDGSGLGTFSGDGPVYFVSSSGRVPSTCEEGKALSWDAPGVDIWRWNASDGASTWNFGEWNATSGASGTRYALSASKGKLASTQKGGGIY